MACPNWFFAYPVDGSFVLKLPPPPLGFRLFGPEDVHLTVAFLGGCGEEAAQRALRTLDALLPGLEAPELDVSFGAVAPMGPGRAYSALSALLERGRGDTEAQIGALRDPLSDSAGVRRDERKPKAHVTIARPQRRATDEQRASGLAWARALDLRDVRTTLDRIALYTWAEARGERLFRRVAERRLRSLHDTTAGTGTSGGLQR